MVHVALSRLWVADMYEDDFLEAAYEERFELPVDEDDDWFDHVDYGGE